MEWRSFWDRYARQSDPHQQVARRAQRPVDEEMLDQITDYIARVIDLGPEDRLLDVCCGNGAITARLAHQCKEVTGIDFSEPQIQNARKRDRPNTRYFRGNALQLDRAVDGSYDKITCYFSFQYFDTRQKGFRVLQQMNRLLNPGGIIFLGDIPDRARKHLFFPLLMPRIRHEVRRLLGREPMGKFWRKNTLDKMASRLGLEGKALEQPDDLLYAHYRFDYLLTKKGSGSKASD